MTRQKKRKVSPYLKGLLFLIFWSIFVAGLIEAVRDGFLSGLNPIIIALIGLGGLSLMGLLFGKSIGAFWPKK